MQSESVEYLRAQLSGADAGTVTAAQIELKVTRRDGSVLIDWTLVDDYDPATRWARALVGPGTVRGQIPPGVVLVRGRITDNPERVVTSPVEILVS